MQQSSSKRLNDQIQPVCYHLSLSILPNKGCFSGSVQIEINLDRSVTSIALHALDLKINCADIHLDGIERISALITMVPSDELLSLTFPKTLSKGKWTLSIEFEGRLNRQMRGLYASCAGGKTFAFTQFEATDARRMFPCFDEPSMKARFRLQVSCPAELVALSNMPAIDDRIESSIRHIQFDETPLMSTYLLALAVAQIEKREIVIADIPVAVWALSDQLHLSNFALKVMQGVLPLLNDYFDLPCPTAKLDLVSIPDFAMGAMENWGAIFFRDSLLLLDEKSASTLTQRAAANVITHEIIHQWFGNLVTMHWWDDLWLNESFATWLACKIVDQWRPEWHSWLSFQQEKEVPLSLDALNSTRSIHADVDSPAEIEEMFDALTYEKGAACLRMIEQYIGESAFRDGIRQYIKKHQYKNAGAEELWKELTLSSGKPLSEIANDWFNQAGFPLIHLKSENEDRSQITLTQSRFFAGKEEILTELPTWSIPISIHYADSEGRHNYSFLLKDPVSHLTLPAKGRVKWLYGNSKQNGFFRIHHEGPLIQSIQQALSKELSPVERIGFLGDLWALTRQGKLPISFFMETLSLFKGDSSRVVLEEVCHYLEILANQLISETDRPLFFNFAKKLLHPTWEVLGWDPPVEDDDEKRLARATLLWTLGAVAQDEAILSELPRRQSRYLVKPASIDPTMATPLVRLCARTDGGTRFEQYLNHFKKSKTPEERDRYLLALTDFGKPSLAKRVMAFTLSNDVRSQDVWKPVRFLLANQAVQGETWNFLKTHWGEFLKKGGSLGGQRMIQATRNLWRPTWQVEVASFFNREENRVDAAKRALLQTLEFIELGIQFKKSQTEALSAWLSKNSRAE